MNNHHRQLTEREQKEADRIGRIIRDHRMRRGLNGKELALKMGISDSHLSHVETGFKIPSYPMLMKFADSFDYTIAEWFAKITKGAK